MQGERCFKNEGGPGCAYDPDPRGSRPREGVVFLVDLRALGALPALCGENDYEKWTPSIPGGACLAGRSWTFMRRVPGHNCFSDKNAPVTKAPQALRCNCTAQVGAPHPPSAAPACATQLPKW